MTWVGNWLRPKLLRVCWLGAAVVVLLLSAVVPLPLGPVVVRVQGSDTIGSELVPDLVLGFLRSQNAGAALAIGGGQGVAGGPDSVLEAVPEAPTGDRVIRFDISSPGSERAFECGVEIGMSSTPIDEAQLQEQRRCGREPTGTAFAADGVAVIANPAVGLTSISMEQLRLVFRCSITEWQDLGLPAGPITLLRRDDDSGTTDVFQQRVLGDDAFCPEATEYADSEELSERVARTPGAIGFVALPFVGGNSVPAVSDAGATAVEPSEENVRSGIYPLGRDLYFYTDQFPSPTVQAFLSYVRSCAGQQIVDETGFYRGGFLACEDTAEDPDPDPDPDPGPDLGPGFVPPPSTPCPPGAPGDYCSFVADATRLPFAVRFDVSSGQVDESGRTDLEQLGPYVAGLGSGAQILLAGFTDGAGSVEANAVLARQRAEEAAAVLRGTGRYDVAVAGFGATYPIADDGTEDGRERNRRVEAWVRFPSSN